MSVPTIITYSSVNAPEPARWIAVFRWGQHRRLPMFFQGDTEAAAAEAARSWWEAEAAKIAKPHPRAKKETP